MVMSFFFNQFDTLSTPHLCNDGPYKAISPELSFSRKVWLKYSTYPCITFIWAEVNKQSHERVSSVFSPMKGSFEADTASHKYDESILG